MDKFLSLKIKTKLTFGIGLLFTMIVLLGGLAVRNITDMSSDTQNILADNYNSLLYSRRMLDALERIKNDPQARAEFEKNLDLQQKNITEIDENVATAHLVAQYEAMYQNLNDTTIQRVRMALNDIMSLNMSTIYRKSKVAEHTADQALLWICIIAVACILIAFAFLIRLPRSITSPIRKLTDGILEIANHNYEKRLDLGDNQEFAEVTSSFNRMAERLTEYRKSTLADIIQAKKYIEAIVNSITEPIIGLDRDRSILFANDEALTILNLKRENVMGKSATELALKNDLLRRLVRELIQPDEKKEPLKIYADDKESYFQAKYIPIHVTNGDGGETEYVGDVILLKNITEFKELDSAKTTFISTISHELKTPLTSISGYAEIMMNGLVRPEDIPRFSETIYKEARRLLTLIEDIIKISKLDDESVELEKEDVDLFELTREIVSRLSLTAAQRNIHMELTGESVKIHGIRQILDEMIYNITENAVKYNKENGNVTIWVGNTLEGPKVRVSDTGIGIPKEHQDRIFERFYRVDKSHSKERGGTGLGLSIVKHGAILHGAKVQVDSEYGKGTRMEIIFPEK